MSGRLQVEQFLIGKDTFFVDGILVQGHRVASGPSKDYPYGSLVKQHPFFAARGLEIKGFNLGTLNITITPFIWEMVQPDFTFHHVAWTDLHPPEDFSFSACRVHIADLVHPGWIYYPHPETKVRHFQDRSLIEVISEYIPAITVGDSLRLEMKMMAIRLK